MKALAQYKGSDLPDEKYPHHTYYGDGSDIEPEINWNKLMVSFVSLHSIPMFSPRQRIVPS